MAEVLSSVDQDHGKDLIGLRYAYNNGCDCECNEITAFPMGI